MRSTQKTTYTRFVVMNTLINNFHSLFDDIVGILLRIPCIFWSKIMAVSEHLTLIDESIKLMVKTK